MDETRASATQLKSIELPVATRLTSRGTAQAAMCLQDGPFAGSATMPQTVIAPNTPVAAVSISRPPYGHALHLNILHMRVREPPWDGAHTENDSQANMINLKFVSFKYCLYLCFQIHS